MNDRNKIREIWTIARIYTLSLGKWTVVSVVTGALCGLIGSLFHVGVEYATELRTALPWLIWCLPLVGLIIVGLYRLCGADGLSTDSIIEAVQAGRGVSAGLIPAIFLSTILTHLCGGSVGREGAALQMGGTIGYQAARLLRLDDRDRRTTTTIGMAAFFSALFGTPVAATVFALSVINVGRIYYAALFPSLIAALSAYGVSLMLHVEPTAFRVTVPEASLGMFLRVIVLALGCALLSVVFCETIHGMSRLMKRVIGNPWLRAVVGGAALILLTLLCGTRDYNGAGMDVITAAVERGEVRPEAFALKLLFTALTLAAGYKGGEVVPSFFVGAAFGCFAGPLLGIPAPFAAAVCLIGLFCGTVNCPLASTFLAIELYGAEGLHFYALTCSLCFVLSGYSGIYSSQRILNDKLKARYIDVRTNDGYVGS